LASFVEIDEDFPSAFAGLHRTHYLPLSILGLVAAGPRKTAPLPKADGFSCTDFRAVIGF
jgi:hypothetical protein